MWFKWLNVINNPREHHEPLLITLSYKYAVVNDTGSTSNGLFYSFVCKAVCVCARIYLYVWLIWPLVWFCFYNYLVLLIKFWGKKDLFPVFTLVAPCQTHLTNKQRGRSHVTHFGSFGFFLYDRNQNQEENINWFWPSQTYYGVKYTFLSSLCPSSPGL